MLYNNVMSGIFEWQVTFSVSSFTIIKFKYWLILFLMSIICYTYSLFKIINQEYCLMQSCLKNKSETSKIKRIIACIRTIGFYIQHRQYIIRPIISQIKQEINNRLHNKKHVTYYNRTDTEYCKN